MTNILLLLAVAGMIVGIYAVAMPTLTRKGWRLPFAGFFSDSDDVEDEPFTPAFELPRRSDVPVVLASPGAAPVEEVAPLPPVLRPANIDEDDPTLTPLFEEVVAEVEGQPMAAAETPEGATAEPQTPHVVVVHSQPKAEVQMPENTAAEPAAEEPQPEAASSASNDMLALFAENPDDAKGPNLIREAVGDVTITDLMEEVRKLREILDKRAA